MSLDQLITLHSREPVQPKVDLHTGILASAYEILEETNARLPEGRRVFRSTIRDVVSRETSEEVAYRSVVNFLNTVENPHTHNPTQHVDLLPAGHPLGAKAPRPVVASFASTDPSLTDETTRVLLASAISAAPDSAARKYFVARLEARKAPRTVLEMISDADSVAE